MHVRRATTQGDPIGRDRGKVVAARNDADIVTRMSEAHREMTADGAGSENTEAHSVHSLTRTGRVKLTD
jgi:hypothetical protein